MSQDSGVRFVRINGRVVPIRPKEGQAAGRVGAAIGGAAHAAYVANKNYEVKQERQSAAAKGFKIGAGIGLGITGLSLGLAYAMPGPVRSAVNTLGKGAKQYGSFVKRTIGEGVVKAAKNTTQTGLAVIKGPVRVPVQKIGWAKKLSNATLASKQYARNVKKIAYVSGKTLPQYGKLAGSLAGGAAIGATVNAGLYGGLGALIGSGFTIKKREQQSRMP